MVSESIHEDLTQYNDYIRYKENPILYSNPLHPTPSAPDKPTGIEAICVVSWRMLSCAGSDDWLAKRVDGQEDPR